MSDLDAPDDGGPDDDGPDGGDPDDGGPDAGGPGDGEPDAGGPGDGGFDDSGHAGGGPDDEELAEMADDLSDVLRDLRDELRASREARGAEPVDQSSGSSGIDVPDVSIDLPSATDVLAFTDEKLIPAAITILEVNIKALELLQKGIRWARPDRAGENARAVQSHAESVSRSTLERLDTVLADLQSAASEGSLPENAEASGIITEARKLRDEIDTALEERARARGEDGEADALAGDETKRPEAADEGPPSLWDEPPEVDVDVEGELESIKAELGKVDDVEDEADANEGGDDADADEADSSEESDEGQSEADTSPDGEEAASDGREADIGDDGGESSDDGGNDDPGEAVDESDEVVDDRSGEAVDDDPVDPGTD